MSRKLVIVGLRVPGVMGFMAKKLMEILYWRYLQLAIGSLQLS